MTIDTEKLRALLADTSRMPRPWRADGVRIYTADGTYVGDHSAAELVVAAVNTLPELLDAVESSRLKAEMYQRDWYEAKSEFGSAMARMSARIRNAEQALATAEADRLTLARALDAATRDLDCGDNSCRFKAHGKGGMRTNGGCSCLGVKDGGGMRGIEVARTVEVARRIVAGADAEVRRG